MRIMERNRLSEGHSQARDCRLRGGVLSGRRKKASKDIHSLEGEDPRSGHDMGERYWVKAWKQPPPSPAKRVAMKLAKDLHRVWSEASAQHLDDVAKTMPVSSTQLVASAVAHTSANLVTAAAFSNTRDKRSPPSPP